MRRLLLVFVVMAAMVAVMAAPAFAQAGQQHKHNNPTNNNPTNNNNASLGSVGSTNPCPEGQHIFETSIGLVCL
jgi:hypothetical protein